MKKDKEGYEAEPDFWTTEAMISEGGSFVKLLGQLWRKGDMRNRSRIRVCFSDYFTQYQQRGKARYKRMYGDD
ncbi:MAG: hypothetical protein ACTSWQ_06650 [Candidatus Thorarchaeota archaeon]